MTDTLLSLAGIALTAVSLIGVLIGFIIKISVKSTRIDARVGSLEEKMQEHEESNREKFRELFSFKGDTMLTMVKIDVNTENISETLRGIRKELDVMNRRIAENERED